MLDAAKGNTCGLGFIEKYLVIDAQGIPFADNTFDIVIANHMLYHVPNVSMALSEISRVLKPEGIFYATTIGNNNFAELIEILHDFDAEIDFAQDSITKAFGLETGKELLDMCFNSVESKRYDDSLHITEAKPLVDYVLSLQGIGNISTIILGEKTGQFGRYIEKIFERGECLDIKKDAGIFISGFPKKL